MRRLGQLHLVVLILGLLSATGAFVGMRQVMESRAEATLDEMLDDTAVAVGATIAPSEKVFLRLIPLLFPADVDQARLEETVGPAIRRNPFVSNAAVREADGSVSYVGLAPPQLLDLSPGVEEFHVDAGGLDGALRSSLFEDPDGREEYSIITMSIMVTSPVNGRSVYSEITLPLSMMTILADSPSFDVTLDFQLVIDGQVGDVFKVGGSDLDTTHIRSVEIPLTAGALRVTARAQGELLTPAEAAVPWMAAAILVMFAILLASIARATVRRQQRMAKLEQNQADLAHEIRERRTAEAVLEHRATHDGLTGLVNREGLLRTLEARLRAGDVSAVLFIDVDHFKETNDSLGHSAGDSLLVSLAERWQSLASDDVVLGRFGGDEFVAIVGHTADPDDVARAMRRLARTELDLGVGVAHPTISVGIRRVDDMVDTAMAVVRDADAAMYEAKRNGRDRSFSFTSDVRDRVVELHSIRTELERALDDGQFAVHYQPVIDLTSGQPTALEALVRWDHPERGLLRPDAFLDVMIDSGLIGRLDRVVMEQAAKDMARVRVATGFEGPVLLNITGADLTDDLGDQLVRAQAAAGLPDGALAIELTEQTVVPDLDRAERILAGLRDRGVMVALDDFGTGYSALAYLPRLPIDLLKLDATFIRDLRSNAVARSIVSSVASLAGELGVVVVAEGVADDATAKLVAELGCSLGQGRYLAVELDVDETVRWLDGIVTTSTR